MATQTLLSPKKQAQAPSTFLGDPLWAPKLMYTVSNMGASAYTNYLAVFYEQEAHYSKVQIGILQTLPCICSIVGPPFWGAIADKYHLHRPINNFAIFGGAILIYMLHFSYNFYLTAVIAVAATFISSPGGSLLDQAILGMIAKYGGEYGKQRLFGAVGWGFGAYVVGLAVAAGGISRAFDFSLTFTLASLLVLRQIPPLTKDGKNEDEEETEAEPKPLARRDSFSEGMSQLLGKFDVLVLFGVVFVMGLMYGVLSSFLTLNLYNLSGGNPQIIGVAIMCETTSELPAFFFSQKLINRVGVVGVLLISIAAYATRITYYAFMTNAWSAIPFEFLHGLTFGIAWAACTQYLYAAAPKGTEGTVMGMLNAVQNGAGRGAGTLIGGYFYQHYGAKTMWLVTDLGVPLSLLGVAAFAYYMKKDGLVQEEELADVVGLLSPATANPAAAEFAEAEKEKDVSYGTV